MHEFLISGHYDLWQPKHQQSAFSVLLSVPHRRHIFNHLAFLFQCATEDIYIEKMSHLSEELEVPRDDLAKLLGEALKSVQTTFDLSEVYCDICHAYVDIDESTDLLLDNYEGLHILVRDRQ